jgi:hypothetical protein
MNTSIAEPKAQKVWFDEDNLWVALIDGRQLSIPLTYFPRLLHANQSDLEKYSISGGGIGIHWENLDEDISVQGLLLGIGDQSKKN